MSYLRRVIASYGAQKIFAFLALLLALVVIAVLGFLRLTDGETGGGRTGGGGTEDPSTVEVPSLVGESIEDAETEHEADFEISVERQYSDEPEGYIIDQTPEAFARVPEGSTLSVVVSDGPEQETITEVDDGYTMVSAHDGMLEVEVPGEWSDVSEGEWVEPNVGEQSLGPHVIATPDLDSFKPGEEATPGVYFAASSYLVERYPDDTANQVLDDVLPDIPQNCSSPTRYDYDDGTFVGREDAWSCTDTGTEIHDIVALPPDASCVVYVQVVFGEADREVLDRIVETFGVTRCP